MGSFCGGRARKRIEDILGYYQPDERLAEGLISWAGELIGPGIFKNINEQKWRFNHI